MTEQNPQDLSAAEDEAPAEDIDPGTQAREQEAGLDAESHSTDPDEGAGPDVPAESTESPNESGEEELSETSGEDPLVPEETEAIPEAASDLAEAAPDLAESTVSETEDETSAPEVQIPEAEAPEAEAPEGPEAEAPDVASVDASLTEAGPATDGNGVATEAPARGRDPMAGPGDWYVVHTYAGYENKVKANLESRVNSMLMQDKIFDVHIPMEDVMEIKGGKKQVVQRKVFPGYLLVKMIYDNDSWYVVRNTPGVTGFVSSGTGTKPTPLSRREVEKILAVKKEEVKPTFRLEWEEGDMVRIISGPFADFNGHISEINVDQSKLKVLVNIFDRETPVELGFDQVAKV
jgi:transcription termination/antitermination protein NusG